MWDLFKLKSKNLLLSIQKKRVREEKGELIVVERLLKTLDTKTSNRPLYPYGINTLLFTRSHGVKMVL